MVYREEGGEGLLPPPLSNQGQAPRWREKLLEEGYFFVVVDLLSKLALETPEESSLCGLELFSPHFAKLGHINKVPLCKAPGPVVAKSLSLWEGSWES